MFIFGIILLIANLVFMFHFIAVGSLMFVVSFLGAIAAVSIIVNNAPDHY